MRYLVALAVLVLAGCTVVDALKEENARYNEQQQAKKEAELATIPPDIREYNTGNGTVYVWSEAPNNDTRCYFAHDYNGIALACIFIGMR